MGLQDLVEALGHRLGHPVTLYDTLLELVAYSVHGADIDEARRTIVLSRRASTRAASFIRRSGVEVSHRPVRIPPSSGARGRVVAPVCLGERLVGYVAYIDDAPPDAEIDPAAARWLAEFAEPIAHLLVERELARLSTQARTETLVGRLFAGRAEAERAARSLLDGELIAVSPGYAVAVVRARPSGPGSRAEGALLLQETRKRITDFTDVRFLWSIVDDDLVFLLPSGHGEPERDLDSAALARIEDAVRALREEGRPVLAGAGRVVPHPVDAAGSYREALDVLRIAELRAAGGRAGGQAAGGRAGGRAAGERAGERVAGERAGGRVAGGRAAGEWGAGGRALPPVPQWGRLGIERLLIKLPLDELGTADLPRPVQRLLDPAVNPVLPATALAYLARSCDAQATARALRIHRSTLYYRLGRIQKIIDADLADGAVRLELHLGLEVADLIGALSATGPVTRRRP